MPLTIAIDYDDTWTAAPELFRKFHRDALAMPGIRIFVVSSRHCDCDMHTVCENHCDIHEATGRTAILTSGSAKKWFMNQRGIKVDIWIDDCPESILQGK